MGHLYLVRILVWTSSYINGYKSNGGKGVETCKLCQKSLFRHSLFPILFILTVLSLFLAQSTGLQDVFHFRAWNSYVLNYLLIKIPSVSRFIRPKYQPHLYCFYSIFDIYTLLLCTVIQYIIFHLFSIISEQILTCN